MKNKLFLFALILFCACHTPPPSNGGWQKVFKNDEHGNTIYGDKSKLIDAIRLGYPVRIGFGGGRVEHFAEADFLTILGDREVFAQISTIVGQAPANEGDTLKMRFRTQNHWTKMAGTNGYATAFMTDYFSDTLVGGGNDRYRSTTWYVLYPNHTLDIEASPL